MDNLERFELRNLSIFFALGIGKYCQMTDSVSRRITLCVGPFYRKVAQKSMMDTFAPTAYREPLTEKTPWLCATGRQICVDERLCHVFFEALGPTLTSFSAVASFSETT
jgi:hypothetical protein